LKTLEVRPVRQVHVGCAKALRRRDAGSVIESFQPASQPGSARATPRARDRTSPSRPHRRCESDCGRLRHSFPHMIKSTVHMKPGIRHTTSEGRPLARFGVVAAPSRSNAIEFRFELTEKQTSGLAR